MDGCVIKLGLNMILSNSILINTKFNQRKKLAVTVYIFLFKTTEIGVNSIGWKYPNQLNTYLHSTCKLI